VISALVAEYFGGPRGGLGALISTSAASSAYARAWAYVMASIVLGLLFYLATLALERLGDPRTREALDEGVPPVFPHASSTRKD
jgi:NitT/TauT family transport system permease protein